MNALSWPALIREARTRAGLTQRELAARSQTTQSAIGRIEAGLGNPNVRSVERLLEAAGFRLHLELRPISEKDPVIAAYKAGIDRTLLRENMKKTPEQRVRALQALARLADEARRAGKTVRRRR
jgi:transcriptional regulator with XRE-family HTH domain